MKAEETWWRTVGVAGVNRSELLCVMMRTRKKWVGVDFDVAERLKGGGRASRCCSRRWEVVKMVVVVDHRGERWW